jgi:hypothetical protein
MEIDAGLITNPLVAKLNIAAPPFLVAKLIMKEDPASLIIPTVNVTCALLLNAVSVRV